MESDQAPKSVGREMYELIRHITEWHLRYLK